MWGEHNCIGGVFSRAASLDDLDDVVHRLKPSQLTLAVKQLVDHVRRIERKAELREELLKRSQKQIDFRDKALKERDAEIRLL